MGRSVRLTLTPGERVYFFTPRLSRVRLGEFNRRLMCTYVEIAVGRDATHRSRAGFASLARIDSDDARRPEAAANRVGDRRASRN